MAKRLAAKEDRMLTRLCKIFGTCFRISLLSSGILIGCIIQWSFAAQYPIDTPTAIVSADNAKFIFPLDKKEQWEWNVAGDGSGRIMQDYKWIVYVGDIMFGFVHFSKGPPQSGNLGDLIAAGKVIAARRIYSEGGRHVDCADLEGVSVQQTCGNIVILVSGKQNVEAIFSSRL